MDYIENKDGGLYAIVNCPECKDRNFVYLGRMEDQTYPDVQGAICRSCQHQWIFPEALEVEPDLEIEDAFLEEGKSEYT